MLLQCVICNLQTVIADQTKIYPPLPQKYNDQQKSGHEAAIQFLNEGTQTSLFYNEIQLKKKSRDTKKISQEEKHDILLKH